MRRRLSMAVFCLLLLGCTVEMPEDNGDPSERGRLEFTVIFSDGEPASGFHYSFEPRVSDSGGVRALGNELVFSNFPAQEYEFTFNHESASEPTFTTVTVSPNAPTQEVIRLPRQ